MDVIVKRRWFVLRTLVGGAAFSACALVASHAAAFSLKVTPIPITITGGATSTMVELKNEGTEQIRIQCAGFDWSQSPAGEDGLAPSTELLIFPSLIAIKPGETRKVRVGVQGGYAANEKSFRVLFSEIPSNVSYEGQEEVVRVTSQVSVPVFVKPPGAVAVPKLLGLSATKDHVRFSVQNIGAAHAMINNLRVESFGADGKSIGKADVAGWYVLPGQTRPFDVDIGKTLKCSGATSLVVTAMSRDSGSVSGTIAQPACAI